MSRQHSNASISQANILCSVWAIGGNGGRQRTIGDLAKTIGEGEGDAEVKAICNCLNGQKTRHDITVSKWKSDVHDRLNRELVGRIVRESLQGANLEEVKKFIHAGLLRGAGLDDKGFSLLGAVLNLKPQDAGTLADSDLPVLTDRISALLLTTPVRNQSRADRSFPPRLYAVGGRRRCGYERTHLDAESERLAEPFAVAAALSAIAGEALGYEDASRSKSVKLPLGSPEAEADFEDLFRQIDGLEGMSEEAYRSYGKSLSRLLANFCPADSMGWEDLIGKIAGRAKTDRQLDRQLCEDIIDGFVAAFYMPADVVKLMRGAYESNGNWAEVLNALINKIAGITKSWATDAARLSEDSRVRFETLSLGDCSDSETLIEQVVNALSAGRGGGLPARVALVSKDDGAGRRTALLAARELHRSGCFQDVFEIMARETLKETLASLSFEGSYSEEEYDRRVNKNAARLEGLPGDSLTIFSDIDCGKWDGRDVVKLSSFGSGSILAIFTHADRSPLPDGFERIDVLESPVKDNSKNDGGNVVPQERHSDTSDKVAAAVLSLIPNGASTELVNAILGDDLKTTTLAVSSLRDGKLYIDNDTRENCISAAKSGWLSEEEKARCYESLSSCGSYLDALSHAAAAAESESICRDRYFTSCNSATGFCERLIRLCDATGDHERAIPMRDMQARWLSAMGDTSGELEARTDSVTRRRKYRVDTDAIPDENITIARLEARLGNYEKGISILDEVIGIHGVENGPGIRTRTLANAYIERGYILHDRWEDGILSEGRLPWIRDPQRGNFDDLDRAISDKEQARKIIYSDSGLRKDKALVARILITLSYSHFYRGARADALQGIKTAVELLRDVSGKQASAKSELDLALAINSWGFFLDDIGRRRQDAEDALKLKKEALEIRRRLLPNNHMDLARSLNNCAISLRALGKLVEAKRNVDEALDIRAKRMGEPGEARKTLIDWNRGEIESALRARGRINLLAASRLRGFQGVMAVHAYNLRGNVVSFRYHQQGRGTQLLDTTETEDEEIFESGSTINVFIDAVLQKAIASKKVMPEEELTVTDADWVGGSGILKAGEIGSRFSLSDVATWMICASDNIATNMIIRRLGVRTINSGIKDMGKDFRHTMLHHPLNFPEQHDFGQTTPKEYAKLLELIYTKKLFNNNAAICDVLLDHLGKQQNSKMLAGGIPPYLLDTYDRRQGNLTRIYSKSGLMNDVRADGGIVEGEFGTYIAVIMAKDFPEILEDSADPCFSFGRSISRFLFDYFATVNLTGLK